MSTVNYSKYTVEELLDVKRSIKSDSANYDSFVAELDNRKEDIDKYYKDLEVASFAFAEHKVNR